MSSSNSDFDAKTMLSFVVETTKSLSLYGPVFQKIAAQHAVRFLAERIGDPNPPSSETLSDCAKYISQNLGKYPNGFCALAYGIGTAQNLLEGGIASGGRSILKEGMKAFLEKMGSASVYGSGTSTTEISKNQISVQKTMRLLSGEDATVTGDENSSSLSYKGCRFKDSCAAMIEDGVRRTGGGIECSNARGHLAVVEYVTKIPHDYEVVNHNSPNCTFRIFKV
ncbi:MAG: hypothetical protein WED05_13165 [Candidatus Atabeyarchaeum deiterrae]